MCVSELHNPSQDFVVAAMYKFVHLPDYEAIREPLLAHMLDLGVKGTLLLAEEGLNGTVAGTRVAIDGLMEFLLSDERLHDLSYKESHAADMPFMRTKVKLKKEIVTMGVAGTDPNALNGQRVDPKDWNALISDPEVLLIDTRNDYEVHIGTFQGAINPDTDTFREFPKYVKENLDPQKHKKVAMFCTGGIRCEKSTNYLLSQGFEEVFHLNGGILKYLEEVPEEESLWRGECFVFDGRVAVGHGLEESDYIQCFACRRPLSEEDQHSPHYVEGVSCPYCVEEYDEEHRQRFIERQKQIELARARKQDHIGVSLDERKANCDKWEKRKPKKDRNATKAKEKKPDQHNAA